MAITKFTQEFKLGVPAKRVFKAMVTESYTVFPKIMPNFIKSIEKLQGDGGAGTIRLTTFHEGAPFPYLKHRIDAVDTQNYVCKFTLIDAPVLGDKVESIYYEQKFEDTSDGGCIVKVLTECRTKGDIKLSEEEIKTGKERGAVFFKPTEEFLLANPNVCA